jgi:hypothetical protein
VSKSFVRVVKKILRLKSYKFTILQKLQEAGDVASVQFCNWFCEVSNGFVDTLLPDANEVWFFP